MRLGTDALSVTAHLSQAIHGRQHHVFLASGPARPVIALFLSRLLSEGMDPADVFVGSFALATAATGEQTAVSYLAVPKSYLIPRAILAFRVLAAALVGAELSRPSPDQDIHLVAESPEQLQAGLTAILNGTAQAVPA